VIWLPVGVCAAAVCGLLHAENKRTSANRALFKMLASSTLVWAALSLDASASHSGRWLLAGVIASWIGDALLLPPGKGRLFQTGIVAFLATHVFYFIALTRTPLSLESWAVGGGVAALTAVVVVRWLRPYVTGSFRVAVPAYVCAITVMLAAAIARTVEGGAIAIVLGGVMFVASDCLVARDRFVKESFRNLAWALPLYFAGQLFLIWGIQSVADV
jgi:uncharacterized membrane protein YhhN